MATYSKTAMARDPRDTALRAQRRQRRTRERERRLARKFDWEDRRMLPAYVVTFVLACGGVAWFSFAPSTLSYWLGGVLAAIPFALLATERAQKRGFDSGPPDFGNDSGPWSGP
jgi:hypothetical protein